MSHGTYDAHPRGSYWSSIQAIYKQTFSRGHTLSWVLSGMYLQCVAVCRSVLQSRIAVCSSVLQSFNRGHTLSWIVSSMCVAVCCSLLQSVAVCCSCVMQCDATCCKFSLVRMFHPWILSWANVLSMSFVAGILFQSFCLAVCCSLLQLCDAVCSNCLQSFPRLHVLFMDVVWCVLQCVAVSCGSV